MRKPVATKSEFTHLWIHVYCSSTAEVIITISNPNIVISDFNYAEEIRQDDHEIYELDKGWLKDADTLVAEVSSPSLGVGYEIGRVEAMGKPILCLYRRQEGRRLSAIIGGNRKPMIVEYDREEEALSAMDDFINALKES